MRIIKSVSGASAATSDGTSSTLEKYSGKWYLAGLAGVLAASTSAPAAGSLYFYPHRFSSDVSLSELGLWLTTAGTNAKIGIYAVGTDGRPTGLCLGSTGNIDVTTGAPAFKSGAITDAPLVLPAGDYYFAAQFDNTLTRCAVDNATSSVQLATQGAETIANGITGVATLGPVFSATGAYGTMPDITGGVFTETITQRGARPFYKVS